jgi:hypothetical protein
MAEYKLFVDDNYHYMDEEERYCSGTFASYEEALAKAKAIVDEFLEQGYQPGMTSKELYEGYVGFGEDPFIIPPGVPPFSAWGYARMRCMELCRDEDAVASILRYPELPPELAEFGAVLLAGLGRGDLGESEREALEIFRRAIEAYPNAMPSEGRWHWLRLESGPVAYTVYLYPDRFQLHAVDTPTKKVDWEIRFHGSGRKDRRVGDAAQALEDMRRAAHDLSFTLKVSAR